MKYRAENGKIIMTEYDSFDIAAILECGQCFRYKKLGASHYKIIAFGKRLEIVQSDASVEFFPSSCEEFETVWLAYFGFDTDYSELKKRLSSVDMIMKAAVEFSPGIRHLRQERFECLISFIISQNNRIPMIMKSVELISQKYGSQISGTDYAFPTPEQLASADISGLMECKVGFRARYIIDAIQKILSGEVRLGAGDDLSTDELREHLKLIKGVGDKVADCVMLFSFGRKDVFPTDVWIIRAVSELYFSGKKTALKTIHDFAHECFGADAGMANQYIYHYARSIGLK